MTQKEIFNCENENLDYIYLYKEGIFWKAYERSAFQFINRAVAYKPTKKFVKTVGADMVSIGFPASILEKHKNNFMIIEDTPTRVMLYAFTIDLPDFALWKESIEYSPKTPQAPSKALVSSSVDMDIINQIKCFNLERKTPLECLQWVAKLKQQLAV